MIKKAPLNSGEAADRIEPRHRERFSRHVRALNHLIAEIREYEPEASWYLCSSGMTLMVGQTHDDRGGAQPKNVAFSMDLHHGDGGDW